MRVLILGIFIQFIGFLCLAGSEPVTSGHQVLGEIDFVFDVVTLDSERNPVELVKNADYLNPVDFHDDMKKISELTKLERETFKLRKLKFLSKVSSFMRTIKIGSSLHNKVLSNLNFEFNDSTSVIAKSQETGAFFRIHLGAAAGASRFLDQLVSKVLRREISIPQFAFYIGVGGSFAVETKPDGGRRAVFNLFVDREKLEEISTAAMQVELIGNGGVYFSAYDSGASETLRGLHRGIFGIFRKNDARFEWGKGLGVSFPPFLPSVSFMDTEVSRGYVLDFKGPNPFLSLLFDVYIGAQYCQKAFM